ncbi:LysR family transcriptional regulator [Pseudomonas putida]|uniref:LysR family transcriptional regulator n=1 Tax=Pseudomonas putida TaxID=303 RepID=A0A4D6XJR9_PSEPU|nr:LysR family transcriptional regulator [Pseudomonas putida]QCI13105.1 LysR family transcriptional regulator [Pseudomonas putida]
MAQNSRLPLSDTAGDARQAGEVDFDSLACRELAARLRQLNLNLLPVLQKLLCTRSVAHTANALKLTPPAISQALRQLRSIFDDQLLVMNGRSGQLTPRGEQLRIPLSRILGELDRLLQPPAAFEPSQEAAHFRIATVDYVGFLLGPGLLNACGRLAPNVTLEFVQMEFHGAKDLSQVDFLIAPRETWPTIGKRAESTELWREDIVCIAGPANDRLTSPIDPLLFQGLRHVGFQLPWASQQTRGQLQPTYSLESSSVCTTPSFLSLGAMVAQTDCVALVPRRLAHALHAPGVEGALRTLEIDYSNTSVVIDLYWSRGTNKRGHEWLRALLKETAAEL